MKKGKLFSILSSFSMVEMKGLQKMLRSPFFNSNKQLELCYLQLEKYHPAFLFPPNFKEKLFKKLYPQLPYNDQKIRKLFTQMRAVAEEYLIHLAIQNDSFSKQRLLAQAYKERQLPSFYQAKLADLSKQLEETTLLDVDLLRESALLAKEYCHFYKADYQKSQYYLAQFINQLNCYFVAERCLARLDLKVLEKTKAYAKPIPFETMVLQMSFELFDASTLNLHLYALLSDLIERSDEPSFQYIKTFYFSCFEQLNQKDQQLILTHLTNFCTNQINLGQTNYRSELLTLYQKGLAEGLFFYQNGQLDAVLFRNIAMVAILNRDFVWTEQFILEYKGKLNPLEKKEVSTICYGYFYFYQNDFQQATELIGQQAFRQLNNALSAKDLLLRSYFELFLQDSAYYPIFNSFAQAFTIFIKRKKIAKAKSLRYLNLIKCLSSLATKMYNLKNYDNLIEKWEGILKNDGEVASKKWVLSKIALLKAKR